MSSVSKLVSSLLKFVKAFGDVYEFTIVRRPRDRRELCVVAPFLLLADPIGDGRYLIVERERRTAKVLADRLISVEWRCVRADFFGSVVELEYAYPMQAKLFAVYVRSVDGTDVESCDLSRLREVIRELVSIVYGMSYPVVIATDGVGVEYYGTTRTGSVGDGFRPRLVLGYCRELPCSVDEWVKHIEREIEKRLLLVFKPLNT